MTGLQKKGLAACPGPTCNAKTALLTEAEHHQQQQQQQQPELQMRPALALPPVPLAVAGGQSSGTSQVKRSSRGSAASSGSFVCEALKCWSCCLIVPLLLLSKSNSLLSALIRPARFSLASTLDDVMRRGEGDTEALDERLGRVFRGSGDAGAWRFKALACASPCDASPLADKLPHMLPPLVPVQSGSL